MRVKCGTRLSGALLYEGGDSCVLFNYLTLSIMDKYV